MRVVITGVVNEKKIQAIKTVRAVTGMGLKDAKYLVDDVCAGTERKIDLSDPSMRPYLDEGYLTYREAFPEFSIGEFVEVLSRYPRGRTVGDLVDILVVVRDLQVDPSSTERESDA